MKQKKYVEFEFFDMPHEGTFPSGTVAFLYGKTKRGKEWELITSFTFSHLARIMAKMHSASGEKIFLHTPVIAEGCVQ